ncbi:MAG: MAPEG family protein [Gammaproteobacteria bacterium]|nr:MAPEG family protein [Gammaproteobacteria bacterium]
MFESYQLAYWGIWVIGTTIFIQAVVASIAHRRQSHYVPGIVDSNLSHSSFVFRSHRTFLNSLENVVMFFIPVAAAFASGMDIKWLTILIWTYAIARIIHMVLYYVIATEKNPSPRSYFYMIALISNLVLIIMLAIHLAK